MNQSHSHTVSQLSTIDYAYINFESSESIYNYAKKLEGHTFREVLELGITPNGQVRDESDYSSVSFKGGMGNLIEERYFGYKANSDAQADFTDAGLELKVTPYDVKADGDVRAGERLVLGMIAYDESIEEDFYGSHLWEKAKDILLIYYERNKAINKLDQRIDYVTLFTPPDKDLEIIQEDYRTVQQYVVNGRANELSESLTNYLGACTKGANAEKSMRDQSVYAPGTPARSRAWCYKNSYMNALLHDIILKGDEYTSIVSSSDELKDETFEEFVLSLIKPYIGLTDKEICQRLGLEYTGNKAQWSTIAYRMLGIRDSRAEEFEKANIDLRTVRIEKNGRIRESLSLNTVSFKELIDENWDDSPLRQYFEETRFLFTAFQKTRNDLVFKGAAFWSMPGSDIDGPLYECWKAAKDTITQGVTIEQIPWGDSWRYENNLPKKTENPIAHMRPHTSKSAYLLEDGTEVGDVNKHGDELPDGRFMTRQSFWLNNDYIYEIVKDF